MHTVREELALDGILGTLDYHHGSGSNATVFLLQCAFSDRDKLEEWALHLAHLGYTTVRIDVTRHLTMYPLLREYMVDENLYYAHAHPLTELALSVAFFEMVCDLSAAVDMVYGEVLAEHAAVDADRVGVVGVSLGGMVAVKCAAEGGFCSSLVDAGHAVTPPMRALATAWLEEYLPAE